MRRKLSLERDIAAQVDDELAHHIRLTIAELEASGLTSEEARREAYRRFGDIGRIRAEVAAIDARSAAEERRAHWWEAIRQDARFALRTLRRTAGYAVVAVLSLAIGIGATTTMVSVVDAVDRRALHFPQGERLVLARPRSPATDAFCPRCPGGATLDELDRWRATLHSFEAIEGIQNGYRRWHDGNDVEVADVGEVTAGTLALLGSTPILGRLLQPSDSLPGAPLAVLLAESIWRARFGADSTVIGRTLWLARRNREQPLPPVAHTIVGVVRDIPGLMASPDGGNQFWTVLQSSPALDRSEHRLVLAGRLKPGATLDDGRTELETIVALDRSDVAPHEGIEVRGLRDALLADFPYGRTRFALLGVVAFVLLLAAVNVANLSLARASARRHELAVRASLGAARGRIVRQLLTESVCVAAMGGVLGTLFAAWGTTLVSAQMHLPLLGIFPGVDGTTLLVAVAVSLVTGIGFGLAPALGMSSDAAHALRRAGSRGSSRRVSARLESGLVISQVALALVLVTGAGLLGSELLGLQRDAIGFDPRHVFHIQVPTAALPNGPRGLRPFVDDLTERVRSTPGVVAASIFTSVGSAVVRTEDQAPADTTRQPYVVDVDERFLPTLRAPIVRGRGFTVSDAGRPVAIVTVSTARAFWPGDDAIGQRLLVHDSSGGTWSTVIGIASDAKWIGGLRGRPHPMIYRPPDPAPRLGVVIIVRTGEDVATTIAALRELVRSVTGATLASNDVKHLGQRIEGELVTPRFNAVVVASFAGFALLLAAMGIYGVVATNVAARTRELGIRIALGARPQTMVALVARRALILTCAGVAVGVGGALAVTRALRSMLYTTSPSDPRALAVAALCLTIVSVVAARMPASRAAKLQSSEVLRLD
jgi:predicted permease